MFTQNYIDLTRARFISSSGATVPLTVRSGSTVYVGVDYAGYNDIGFCMKFARCYEPAEPYESTASNSNYNPGVWFGRGKTPASLTDYALEDQINSGLTCTNGSDTTMYVEDGKYIASATYTVLNNTDEEMTINEVGLYCQQCRKVSSSKFNIYHVLMERTVLDTPITIAPGAAKTITYKITFNQSVS